MADAKNNKNNNTTDYRELGTDAAMNLVLKAEHDAQQAVVDCEKEAQAQLEQAREKAHRIAQRSDARITRIHHRADRLVTDEINRIQEDAARQRKSEQANRINDSITTAAVEALAALLTGAADSVIDLHQDQDKLSTDKPAG
jgi:F0F1-type ATP synthase membrane subunit b/b'